MQQNSELSVEEILASIKKVIARDNRETATADRRRRETEGVVVRGPGSSFSLSSMSETVIDDDHDEDTDEDEDKAGAEEDADNDEVLDLVDAATEMLHGEDDHVVVSGGSFAPASDETADSEIVELLLVEDLADDEPAGLLDPTTHPQTPVEAQSATPVGQSLEAFPIMPESTAPHIDPALPEAETPLERMVRESLRPMLREWLDTNLPPIVEKMVKSELERIMGKPS